MTWNRTALTALAAAALLRPCPAAAQAVPLTPPPESALIDKQIERGWEQNKLTPAAPANDRQFLRRVFLDLIGRIPTYYEVLDYERDARPDRRIHLVRRLLHSTDYKPLDRRGNPIKLEERGRGKPDEVLAFDYAAEHAQHWANVWTTLLMTRSAPERYREQMNCWLYDQFAGNTPYDQFVRELLTASGKNNENGAVNYFVQHLGEYNPAEKRDSEGVFDAVPITSRTTRLFLGVQTQCTQCHDHPFNPGWKQENYWGVNAFFRQTVRDTEPELDGNEVMPAPTVEVSDQPELNRSGAVYFEQRNGLLVNVKARFLRDLAADPLDPRASDKTVPFRGAEPRRQLLADYVAGHDNFAKAAVNRVWAHLFGRGLNELPAPDDFGDHNPVVHPELLDQLAGEFQRQGYDIKKLLEWVCLSRPYNLSYVAPPAAKDAIDDAPYFTHMAMKSMSPEQLFNSIMTAMGRQIWSPRVKFDTELQERRERFLRRLVQNFGDDEGNEVSFNGTVIQALMLMNGEDLNRELGRDHERNPIDLAIARGAAQRGSDRAKELEMIDSVYLTVLGRHPSDDGDPAFGPNGRGGYMSELGLVYLEMQNAKAALLTDREKVNWVTEDMTRLYAPFLQDLFWALLNTNEFILNH